MCSTMCRSLVSIEVRPRGIVMLACCLALCWLPLPSFAQDAAPPAAKPGVFESIGRWFDQGASNFRDQLRGAKRKMDDLGNEAAANNKDISDNAAKIGQGAAEVGKGAADATKNAVDAVAKLPTARMMSGREP